MCCDGLQGIISFSLLGLVQLCDIYLLSHSLLIRKRGNTEEWGITQRSSSSIPFISSLMMLLRSHITSVYSLRTYGLWPTRLFCLWDSPGKNTGEGCRALLPFLSSFISVAHSCLTCWDPMDCGRPGFHVHHQLLEFTQTPVHQVSDAIQPSHPLSSSSPPTFDISQHPDLFQWVSASHQVAKVLEFQLQHQSFQWIFTA